MPSSEVSLPALYLRQIANQLSTMGVDVAAWLARQSLRESDLGDGFIPLSFSAFRNLLLDARQQSRDPAIGLLVGQRLLVNTHGMLGYAAMNSESIRQVIELFARFLPLRTSLVRFVHEEKDGLLRMHLEEGMPLGDVRRLVLEAVVLAMKNVLDFITMGAGNIHHVAFPFEPDGQQALAAGLFKCDVRYNSTWAGFALPLDVLDIPLKMADPAAFRDAADICQRELDKLNRQARFSLQVQRLMLETQGGFPSLQVTARLFHMTPRTLHRRLLDEGTSYKDILENVRHRLAIEHLKAGHLDIQEIAYSLGYTDTANFRRAFKRWEGVPPSEFRLSLTGCPAPPPA